MRLNNYFVELEKSGATVAFLFYFFLKILSGNLSLKRWNTRNFIIF